MYIYIFSMFSPFFFGAKKYLKIHIVIKINVEKKEKPELFLYVNPASVIT
jgi:hypothetical protein